MTLLSDMRKMANAMAKKNKEQEKQAKVRTTTTGTKATTNLTPEQKKQAINSINNIKSQGVIKGSMTNAKQGAETKAEKSFYNRSTDKEISAYKTMVNEGYTPAEARKAIDTVTTQKRTVTTTRPKTEKTVDTWTNKQQNAYDTLVSEGYSEKEAKKAVQKAIQKDWDTGKKVKTAVKSFGQGVSDVGQRTVGRVFGAGIDRVEGKLDNLYENNEGFQNFVNKAGTGLKNSLGLTDEQVQAFQQSEALRKEQGIPSTYGSILTDEEASSRIGTVGRKSGQIVGTTALSMAAGGVAGGGAKAIGTAAGSKVIGGLAGTALGAGEGALSADIFTRGLEDRAATKNERIAGAALGGIFGGVSGYRQTAKALAQNKELAGLVQDTSNRGVKRAIKEGRVTTKKGLLKTETVQELSQKEKDALNIIKKEGLGNSKNPGKLVTNIQKSVAKTASEMSDDMKNIKVSDWGKQELKTNLQDAVKNANTTAQANKIKAVINKLNNITNADDLWGLRQDYDDLFTEAVKSYNPNGPTPMQEIWMEGRGILTDAMNKAAENAGTSAVKEGMKRLSTMITAENTITNNLAKQVGKEQLTRLGKIFKGVGKTTKKALGPAVAGGGGVAIGAKIVGNNSSE